MDYNVFLKLPSVLHSSDCQRALLNLLDLHLELLAYLHVAVVGYLNYYKFLHIFRGPNERVISYEGLANKSNLWAPRGEEWERPTRGV